MLEKEPELLVELVGIDKITENPDNPNDHPPEQIESFIEQFKYQGIRIPFIVSKQTGLLVVGHGRIRAARKMGLKKVPVSYQDFTDPAQEYAFAVADNALAQQSMLNFAKINVKVPDLGPDFDIALLGLKDFSVDVSEKDSNQEKPKNKANCPHCGREL